MFPSQLPSCSDLGSLNRLLIKFVSLDLKNNCKDTVSN